MNAHHDDDADLRTGDRDIRAEVARPGAARTSDRTPPVGNPRFASIEDVRRRLADVGYLASTPVATAVYLADRLEKPILAEGHAGVGKTDLARAVADATGADLLRLQCYEGVDETRALYEWNHAKQLLRITSGRSESWEETKTSIFTEEFLLERPLLAAIRATQPTVLVIDEVDKAEVEIEGLLLEVLGEYQVTVAEFGTIRARRRPFVVLTSNGTRELSEALRRRCLFLSLDFPDSQLEYEIVRMRVPELDGVLAKSLVEIVQGLRALPLRKLPSIAETLDWARALLAFDATSVSEELMQATLGVVLKHDSDVAAAAELLATRAG